MEERRQEARQRADWPGLCYLEGKPRKDFRHCLVMDFSTTGFGLRAAFPTDCDLVGERLCVEVPAIGDSVNFRLAGVVRSCRPIRVGMVRLGIEFDPLSMTERSILEFLGAPQGENVFSFI